MEIKKEKKENNQKTIYKGYKVADSDWKKLVSKSISQSKSKKSATKISINDKNRRQGKKKGKKVGIGVKKQSSK